MVDSQKNIDKLVILNYKHTLEAVKQLSEDIDMPLYPLYAEFAFNYSKLEREVEEEIGFPLRVLWERDKELYKKKMFYLADASYYKLRGKYVTQ